MSVLVKESIIKRLEKGDLSFDPGLDSFQIQTHSVDLRLGYTFLVPRNWKISDKGRVAIKLDYESSDDHFEVVELENKQFFEILPREYIVVSTLEKIKIPKDIMAVLYPRSSINRRGLSVDISGIVDAGYEGNLIIPLRNNTDGQVIKVYPGERFCQLVFHQLEEPVKSVRSRYAKKDIIVGVLGEKHTEESKLVRNGGLLELKKKFGIKLP